MIMLYVAYVATIQAMWEIVMAQEIVGSRMPTLASDALHPSDRGYGQNGFAGPSSDEPGQNSKSGFLPGVDLAAAVADNGLRSAPQELSRSGMERPRGEKGGHIQGPQTRHVSDAGYPPSFGMTSRSPRDR